MTATDVAAYVGAITGPLALGWEIYKWWTKGCRLRASTYVHSAGPAGKAIGGERYIRLNVRNVGDAATTITRVAPVYFYTTIHRLRWDWKTKYSSVEKSPDLPVILESGREIDFYVRQDGELSRISVEHLLYIGVWHSMGGKNPMLARVEKFSVDPVIDVLLNHRKR